MRISISRSTVPSQDTFRSRGSLRERSSHNVCLWWPDGKKIRWFQTKWVGLLHEPCFRLEAQTLQTSALQSIKCSLSFKPVAKYKQRLLACLGFYLPRKWRRTVVYLSAMFDIMVDPDSSEVYLWMAMNMHWWSKEFVLATIVHGGIYQLLGNQSWGQSLLLQLSLPNRSLIRVSPTIK